MNKRVPFFSQLSKRVPDGYLEMNELLEAMLTEFSKNGVPVQLMPSFLCNGDEWEIAEVSLAPAGEVLAGGR